MTKPKFDVKFDVKLDDLRTEATRSLYAGAGVADIAVEAVREYVADVQKKLEGLQQDVTAKVTEVRGEVSTKVTGVQKDVTARVTDARTKVTGLEPKDLPARITPLVYTGVEALSADAKARRAAIEAKVAGLQSSARSLPAKAQTALKENVATAGTAYNDLAKRGELAVRKFRGELAESIDDTADKVEDVVKPAPVTKAPARKSATAAKKTPAKKTTTAKTTTAAKKTPAKKTTTAKSGAAKTTTTAAKQTPAKKTSAPEA